MCVKIIKMFDLPNAKSLIRRLTLLTSKIIIQSELTLIYVDLNGKLHADQTGRFPVTSIKVNNHLIIACDYDSKAILEYTLKSKTEHNYL